MQRISGEYEGEPRLLRIPCELRVRESTVGVYGSPVDDPETEGGDAYWTTSREVARAEVGRVPVGEV
jgi:hypothetical protein